MANLAKEGKELSGKHGFTHKMVEEAEGRSR